MVMMDLQMQLPQKYKETSQTMQTVEMKIKTKYQSLQVIQRLQKLHITMTLKNQIELNFEYFRLKRLKINYSITKR